MQDVIHVLYNYITTSKDIQAVKCISKIIQHALFTAPTHRLRFIEVCCLHIRVEIEGSKSGSEYGDDSANVWSMRRSDGDLHWYQYILASCLRGATVTEFISAESCLDLMVDKICSVDIYFIQFVH